MNETEIEKLAQEASRKPTVAATIVNAVEAFPLFQITEVRPEKIQPAPAKVDDYISENEDDDCWWYRLPIHEMTGIDKLLSTVYLLWMKKNVKEYTDQELVQNNARQDPKYT